MDRVISMTAYSFSLGKSIIASFLSARQGFYANFFVSSSHSQSCQKLSQIGLLAQKLLAILCRLS